MIKSGRYGLVRYDPNGAASPEDATALISINSWKLSLKTDYIDVTCFQDENKVYVPGMKDVSGSIGGFWNSDSRVLFDAADADSPGMLALYPNSRDPGGSPGTAANWSGLAYMDADIDTSVTGAPAISGTFRAAGTWTLDL
jgi:hypothetical protein